MTRRPTKDQVIADLEQRLDEACDRALVEARRADAAEKESEGLRRSLRERDFLGKERDELASAVEEFELAEVAAAAAADTLRVRRMVMLECMRRIFRGRDSFPPVNFDDDFGKRR